MSLCVRLVLCAGVSSVRGRTELSHAQTRAIVPIIGRNTLWITVLVIEITSSLLLLSLPDWIFTIIIYYYYYYRFVTRKICPSARRVKTAKSACRDVDIFRKFSRHHSVVPVNQ